jgi:hypothetical protein
MPANETTRVLLARVTFGAAEECLMQRLERIQSSPVFGFEVARDRRNRSGAMGKCEGLHGDVRIPRHVIGRFVARTGQRSRQALFFDFPADKKQR